MANIQDIHLLYNYNYWATRRMLDACTDVSPEQLRSPILAGSGSLYTTLIHMLDSEYRWRILCQHNRLTSDLTEADLPTYAAIVQRWHDEENNMRMYLDSLEDAHLTSLVRYTTPEGDHRERVLWHCLVHVVNHGTQHRSEAAMLLTSFGHSPGGLDLTAFLNEQPSR